jgi:hypothetical protein
MTRDEIRLVAFILLALIVGAIVQWWMKRNPHVATVQVEQARKSGWADPPYVFKSRAEMEQMAERVKAMQSDLKEMPAKGVTTAQPAKE